MISCSNLCIQLSIMSMPQFWASVLETAQGGLHSIKKKGQRAKSWIQKIVQSTKRFVRSRYIKRYIKHNVFLSQLDRKCVRKLTTSPEDAPGSVLKWNCALGVRDVFTLCDGFGDFLDWVFSECPDNDKRLLLEKRCNKIHSWVPNKWYNRYSSQGCCINYNVQQELKVSELHGWAST